MLIGFRSGEIRINGACKTAGVQTAVEGSWWSRERRGRNTSACAARIWVWCRPASKTMSHGWIGRGSGSWHYQNHRLRALLGYARERSPFHARRLREIDPSRASVADLASLPVMTKQDAQEQWDAIVTAPISIVPAPNVFLLSSNGFRIPKAISRSSVRVVPAGSAGSTSGTGSSLFRRRAWPGERRRAKSGASRAGIRSPPASRYWRPVLRRMPAHRCSMYRQRRAWRRWSSPRVHRSTKCWPRSRPRDPPTWSAIRR